MSLFTNPQTLQELKCQYKSLALKYHPDMGGTTEQMQELNNEYEMFCKTLKITGKIEKDEKPEEYVREFYTQNGWSGKNYHGYISFKEQTKILRNGIKAMFPLCKWSVSFSTYSGGGSIYVTLVEAPFEVFKDTSETNAQLNQYYIKEDTRLTERAIAMMEQVNDFICSYRYDDSDAMIDYFDTNFYYNLNVGKWNKPFRVVKKTDRIGTQANPKNKEIIKN